MFSTRKRLLHGRLLQFSNLAWSFIYFQNLNPWCLNVHEALACCEQENPQKYGRAKLFIICDCLQIIVTHQDVPLPKLVKSLDDFPRKWRRFEEHWSELHFSLILVRCRWSRLPLRHCPLRPHFLWVHLYQKYLVITFIFGIILGLDREKKVPPNLQKIVMQHK